MVEQLFIKGVALCCPDLQLLAAFNCPKVMPDPQLIPAPLRRRASLTTRIAITAASAACQQARVDVAQLPSVFASVGGEMQVTDALCRLLPKADELLSPTQFHNSVHNTTAGYWAILNHCQAPNTALAALDDTFAMGLLEAWVQLQVTAGEVLLVCYDETWPQYLAPPLGQFACASAWVLSTDRQQALGAITVPISQQGTISVDPQWSALVDVAPAVAALPLLCALHNGQQGLVPLNNKNMIWTTQYEGFNANTTL